MNVIAYDVKANPQRYLQHFMYMNKYLEVNDRKMFQPLCLRNSIVPKYCTFDTASLLRIFGNPDEKCKSVKDIQKTIWGRLFHLQKKVFKRNGYVIYIYKRPICIVFKHHGSICKSNLMLLCLFLLRYKFFYYLQPDGIGCSLLFKSVENSNNRANRVSGSESHTTCTYVQNLSNDDIEMLKSRPIVGCDPGKYSMVCE